jgi:predicted DNA-binding transcriptional regulator AlpA
MPDSNAFDAIRIVDQVTARQLLGLSSRTWDRLRARGEAPPHIQLSERRVGYRLIDLQKWIDARDSALPKNDKV